MTPEPDIKNRSVYPIWTGSSVEDLLSRGIALRFFKTRDEQEVAGYAESMFDTAAHADDARQ